MGKTFAPNPLACTLGRGKVLLNRFNDALQLTEFILLGNVSEMKTVATDDVAEVYTYQDRSAGLYASAVKRRKVEISFKGWEFNEDNVALATAGDLSDYVQTGGVIAGEPLATALVLGGVYATAQRQISAVTVHDTTAASVLAEGTDYEILDAEAGEIHILPAGGAIAGDALTIDYTAPAIGAGDQLVVSPFTHGQVHASLKFLADPIQGMIWKPIYWHVLLDPKELGGLISEDFDVFDLNVRLLNDAAGLYGGSAQFPYAKMFSVGNQ